jgi:MOSC domain-containing protein YiiM
MLKTLNLDGDRQADLIVHGRVDKAVYAYPIEHYEYWRKVFPYI